MSHTSKMRVGDVGTEVRVRVQDQDGDDVDTSAGGAVRKIYLEKPDGSVLEKTAVPGSTEDPTLTAAMGYMHYITVDGDIDQRGIWEGEGYLEIGFGKWTSTPFDFLVENPKRF